MSFEGEETTEAHERRITRCNSCRARIIWLPTPAGRAMPIDADTVGPDDQEFQHGKHGPHWATCPNADQHRKPK